MPWWFVPWWLVWCLVGSWAVTCMPWSLCLSGWCLVGSWLVCPLLMYLGACALVVGVLGRFVVGGYLHALELVPWWLVCPWLVVCGYLCTLELVPWWLVLVGSGYLHTLNLVPCWLVCPWLVCLVVVTCMPWSSCLGGWCLVGSWLVCPLLMYLGAFVLLVGVLGMFVVGGYLHALELVPWWLVCPWLVLVGGYLCTLEFVPWWLAVTCVPWSSCLGGWCAW